MLLIAFKLFVFLIIAFSADFWAWAFTDPGYASSVQWLLMSVFGYFASLVYGPLLYYVCRVISAAGIAGASASLIYHFLGKTPALIIFIILLCLLAFHIYLRRNSSQNVYELRYKKGRQLYFRSLKAEKREEKLALLKKSADRGYIPALTGMGTLLCQGTKPSEQKKGIELLKQAAPYESVAGYNLGLIYFEGRIVPRDISAALRYTRQSVALGDKVTELLIEEINDSLSPV